MKCRIEVLKIIAGLFPDMTVLDFMKLIKNNK